MNNLPLTVCYKMEPLTSEELGPYIEELISKYLPAVEGDEAYKEICKDYGNKGTTCGFLVHWILWRIRYLNPKVTNRTEKEDGLSYVSGANISRVWNNSRPPFRAFKKGTKPETGDVCYISNGSPMTEHVFVFLREETDEKGQVWWVTADGGQPPNGRDLKIVRRRWTGTELAGAYNSRKLVGWIPVRELALDAGAALLDGTKVSEPICGLYSEAEDVEAEAE